MSFVPNLEYFIRLYTELDVCYRTLLLGIVIVYNIWIAVSGTFYLYFRDFGMIDNMMEAESLLKRRL